MTLFFKRTFNLERHLTTCSERVKDIYPRKVYQIQKTLFDKLYSFGIKCTSQQKLFKNLAVFDFESIGVQEETFKDTKSTTWIPKHFPISVSISSNFVKDPFFLYNSNAHHVNASFIGALEGLASQSKTQTKLSSFTSKQQLRLNWAASGRNSPNVKTDGSTREGLS